MASLARLADVELQLVMHGLEIKDLLRFARCSKRIMHAADSSFAWTASAPLCIDIPMPLPALHSLLQSRLTRHAPLSVTLWYASISGAHWIDSAHFAAISASIRRIFAFDASQADLTSDAWKRLLAHPCMRSVRVMRCGRLPASAAQVQHAVGLGGNDNSQIMRALIGLPHLHTLQLEQHDVRSCEYSMLHLLPSLTSLLVCDLRPAGGLGLARLGLGLDSFDDDDDEQDDPGRSRLLLDPIITTACANLREFTVQDLTSASFGPLLSATSLRQLRALTLEQFACSHADERARRRGHPLTATPDEAIAVFSSLTQLQRLELIACNSVDLILAHAHLAVSLRFITLRASADCWCLSDGSDELGPHDRDAMPRLSVIAALLAQSVSLQRFLITFQAKWGDAGLCSKRFQRGVERHFKLFVDAPELTPFGQRFQMRVELGQLKLDSSKRQPERRGCSVQ